MAHAAEVARGTRADVTWHARPRGKAVRRPGGARWGGGVARPHGSTRTPGWHHVACGGLAGGGPTC